MILVLSVTFPQTSVALRWDSNRKLVIRQLVKTGEIRQERSLAVQYHFLDVHVYKTKMSVDPEYDTCAMIV
jgi:hypothetical protein